MKHLIIKKLKTPNNQNKMEHLNELIKEYMYYVYDMYKNDGNERNRDYIGGFLYKAVNDFDTGYDISKYFKKRKYFEIINNGLRKQMINEMERIYIENYGDSLETNNNWVNHKKKTNKIVLRFYACYYVYYMGYCYWNELLDEYDDLENSCLK